MSHKLIAPIYKSIMRYTADVITEINATPGYPPVQYHDWESRGDENSLPRATLIGVEAFGFRENRGLWDIRFGLGISSYRDANLLQEIELIDFLQTKFGEGCKVPLYDIIGEAAQQVSELVSTDFESLPMSQSSYRNYREIGIELKRTGT